MVKICRTGLLKLNFEIIPKKRIFWFCQKFPQAMDEVEKFVCQFPNPWTLRVSGMGGYISKCEKKSKSLHPIGQLSLVRNLSLQNGAWNRFQEPNLELSRQWGTEVSDTVSCILASLPFSVLCHNKSAILFPTHAFGGFFPIS